MGYGSTGPFLQHANWMRAAGIAPPAAICSLGDQTVPVRAPEDLDNVRRFIEGFGRPFNPAKYEAPGRYHARRTYEEAGFEYVSLDLNEADGSIAVDLNHWPPVNMPDRRFDMVTNYGTTEHCPNQIPAFAIIHYLTRPGGIIVHDVPVLNFLAHAMVCATPYFFKKLIDGNGYRVLHAKFRSAEVNRYRAFHFDKELEFIEGYRDAIEQSTVASILELVVQKMDDSPFVPPLDIAGDDAGTQAFLQAGIKQYRWPAAP